MSERSSELLEQLTAKGFAGQSQGRHQTMMHRTDDDFVDILVHRPQYARASRIRKFVLPYPPPDDDLPSIEGEPCAVYEEVLSWPHESQ